MTALLASVMSPAEARIALDGGADILDIKNPGAGVLGAVEPAMLRQIVELVAGRRPVSATVGDLPLDAALVAKAVTRTRAAGVDIIKVGFFEPGVEVSLLQALAAETAKGARIVAVFFADRRPELSLLPVLATLGLTGVMLDTAEKRHGSLRQILTDHEIRDFVVHARSLGLLAGLAGSLRLGDIAPLLGLEPDYLGFRGALCEAGQRTSGLNPIALRQVRMRIPVRHALRLQDQPLQRHERSGMAQLQRPCREQANGKR